MTKINGFGAYQNTMMSALNRKQKADADKTAKKAEEQDKLRTAKNDKTNKADKAGIDTPLPIYVSDYIAGMTDSFAVSSFNEIYKS